jgi:predicted DNA-binding antitoxin AbrB/MazE fold protein
LARDHLQVKSSPVVDSVAPDFLKEQQSFFEYNWGMTVQVDAVYENGLLRPLEPLSLAEQQRVKLTISDSVITRRDMAIVEQARAEVSGLEKIPTIDEVRAALSAIPGSLSDDVVAERGDY